jgi:hypothetical protein
LNDETSPAVSLGKMKRKPLQTLETEERPGNGPFQFGIGF